MRHKSTVYAIVPSNIHVAAIFRAQLLGSLSNRCSKTFSYQSQRLTRQEAPELSAREYEVPDRRSEPKVEITTRINSRGGIMQGVVNFRRKIALGLGIIPLFTGRQRAAESQTCWYLRAPKLLLPILLVLSFPVRATVPNIYSSEGSSEGSIGVLRSDGKAFGWGLYGWGSGAIPPPLYRTTPTRNSTDPGSSVIQIARYLYLKSDGTVLNGAE